MLCRVFYPLLSSAIANFWWKTNENSNSIHWIAWDKLCIPHSVGGNILLNSIHLVLEHWKSLI